MVSSQEQSWAAAAETYGPRSLQEVFGQLPRKLYFSDPLNVSRGKIEQKNMLLGGCTVRHSVAQGWGWGDGGVSGGVSGGAD